MKFSIEIKGEPHTVVVTSMVVVAPWKGSRHSCPSDLDWTGYVDMDYEVFNFQGIREHCIDGATDKLIERLAQEQFHKLSKEEEE